MFARYDLANGASIVLAILPPKPRLDSILHLSNLRAGFRRP